MEMDHRKINGAVPKNDWGSIVKSQVLPGQKVASQGHPVGGHSTSAGHASRPTFVKVDMRKSACASNVSPGSFHCMIWDDLGMLSS